MRPSLMTPKVRPTMLRVFDSGVAVVVHSDELPSDPDWNEYVAWVKDLRPRLHGILAVTDGPGPNTHQRTQLSTVEDVTAIWTGVITGSMQARGIATALSWFGHRIRAYKPSDLEGAFAFVKLPPSRWRVVVDQIAAMRAEHAGVQLEDLIEGVPSSATRETARHAVIHERLERVRARAIARRAASG